MFKLFKQDAQRWIVPKQIADPSLMTWPVMFRLLARHMSLRAMFWYRFGSWCRKENTRNESAIQRFLYRAHGLEISPGTDIGGGLYIAHPIGTVIFARHIGTNCTIISSVTIGLRKGWDFPVIGDNVYIGAGARVLGGIHVGDGAVIGANAVVIYDVPAGATVVGVPAREIQIKEVGELLAK